jgi:hypothetical protein
LFELICTIGPQAIIFLGVQIVNQVTGCPAAAFRH